MTPSTTALAHRFVGRLFSDEGRLHFVLDVDVDAETARVSYRCDGQQCVEHMPLAEVGARLAASSDLRLDGLSESGASSRITRDADGWFFSTREGLKGPYDSEAEANRALRKHVLSLQGAP